MENIIPLILFTYPGAVAEYVYNLLSAEYAFHRKPDEVFRVARDFFLSALVTALCLLLSGEKNLATLTTRLQDTGCLFSYLAESLAASAALGAVWFAARLAIFRAMNRGKAEKRDPTLGERQTVWQDLFSDPELCCGSYVAEIRQNGALLRAGIVYEYTRDLQTDPGMILMHSAMIEADLARPAEDRALVGLPYAHYMDLNSGMEVSFYDGDRACAFLQEYQATASASSAEAPAVPSASPEPALDQAD